MAQSYQILYDLPKRLLLKDIEQRGCIHQGVINFADSVCWRCSLGNVCLSMLKTIERETNSTSAAMTAEEYRNFLKFSRIYIDFKINQQRHSPAECDCEMCQWFRESEVALHDM